MKRIISFFCIFCAIALLLSRLSCFVSPKILAISPFVGILFPIFLVFCAIVFFLAIVTKNRKVFWLLAAAIFSWSIISRSFQISFSQNKSGIKVISYNVKNFDLYNWTGNHYTRQGIFDFFRQEQAEIICLQEYFNDKKNHLNNSFFKDSLGYSYQYFFETYHLKVKDDLLQWGITVFSKYPIVDAGSTAFKRIHGNACFYADLKIKEDTIRVFNMHLKSIQLDDNDYNTIEEVTETQNTKWNKLKKIIYKIMAAGALRSEQADKVHDEIVRSPYPVLVCADFNDMPISYIYERISEGLHDSFREKGLGFNGTYVYKLPFFRIDQILASEKIKFQSYRVGRKELSDHFPVISTFTIEPSL